MSLPTFTSGLLLRASVAGTCWFSPIPRKHELRITVILGSSRGRVICDDGKPDIGSVPPIICLTATVKSIELAAFMDQAGSDYVLAGRVLHTGSIVLTHAVGE